MFALSTTAILATLLGTSLASTSCSHVCKDICAHAWDDCTTLLPQNPANFELCKHQDKSCRAQCEVDECANPELWPSLPHTNFITANDATTTFEPAGPAITTRADPVSCAVCLNKCNQPCAGWWNDAAASLSGMDKESFCKFAPEFCVDECYAGACKLENMIIPPPALQRRQVETGVCTDTCAEVLPNCVRKWDPDKCVKQHSECLNFCVDHPDIAPYVLEDGATIVVHPPVDFVPPPGSSPASNPHEKRCAHTCNDFCSYVLEKCLWNPPECSFGDFCSIQDQKCNQWCREVGKCHPKTSHDGSVIVFNDPNYDVPFGAGCSSRGIPPTTLSKVVKPSETPFHTTPVEPNDMPEEASALSPPVKRQSERCQAFCTDACNETRKLCEANGNYDCEGQYQACFPKCYDTWCGVFDDGHVGTTTVGKRDEQAAQGDCPKCEEACANSYFVCLVGSGPECWYQYQTCIPMCYKDWCPNVPTPLGPTEPPKEKEKQKRDEQGAPVPASASIDKRQLSPVTGCNPCVKDDFYEKKMCLDRAKKDAKKDRRLYEKKSEKCEKASKKRLEKCKPCMDFS